MEKSNFEVVYKKPTYGGGGGGVAKKGGGGQFANLRGAWQKMRGLV